MSIRSPFNSLLLPTDFSDQAWSAFQHARLLVDGVESEIVVVHVIDPGIVGEIVRLGFGDQDSITETMREHALKQLEVYTEESNDTTNVDTLVSIGEPFFEIISRAEDFAVDVIVMSKLGQRSQPKSLLFGSTAEKVIRGSKKPVIVLPSE